MFARDVDAWDGTLGIVQSGYIGSILTLSLGNHHIENE